MNRTLTHAGLRVLFPLLLCVAGQPVFLKGQDIITTVAGRGRVVPANSGLAVDLPFSALSGLAVDRGGNVYISDESYHVVFKVTPDGIYTRYAGNGIAGFSGDGGPAVVASLNMPGTLAIDSGGNLYIGDYNNARIRMVNPSGVITTVAGGAPLLYPNSLTDGAPAASSAFNAVEGLAVGAGGDLYVNSMTYIYKATLGGKTRLFAGNGNFQSFSGDGLPPWKPPFAIPRGSPSVRAGTFSSPTAGTAGSAK